MDKGPTTDWIARAAAGDEAAFEWILNQYFERLVTLARRKLVAIPRQVADDEGAVVSALRSFFSGILAGQFPRLSEESDLWKVLATITVRKSIAQIRRHWKQSGESDHIDRSAEVREQLDSSLLAPDEIAAFIEQCEQLIDMLDDESLKQIALWRLEGYETREIADRLNVHPRTVQRKLVLIERIWLAEEPSE